MASTIRIGTSFIPVSDPSTSAEWYEEALGLRPLSVNDFSAVLEGNDGSSAVTLMGPASGIAAAPGLPWATCNFVVDALAATHERLASAGLSPSTIAGDGDVCLFFTVQDLDGNTLLLVDR